MCSPARFPDARTPHLSERPYPRGRRCDLGYDARARSPDRERSRCASAAGRILPNRTIRLGSSHDRSTVGVESRSGRRPRPTSRPDQRDRGSVLAHPSSSVRPSPRKDLHRDQVAQVKIAQRRERQQRRSLPCQSTGEAAHALRYSATAPWFSANSKPSELTPHGQRPQLLGGVGKNITSITMADFCGFEA